MTAARARLDPLTIALARAFVFLGVLAAGGLGAPRSAAASDADTLRVLIYNIRHGRGMDMEVDLPRTADVIRAQRPDVVLLQEVDRGAARSGGVDQARTLSELTGLPHHAFGAFMDYDGGEYGMALLSAHPLLEVHNHRLPPGTEPRTSLAARIDPGAPWGEIVFVGIHFYRTPEERLAQARALVEILADEAAPVILAGDFNSRPDDPVMRLVRREWSFPEKEGSPFTFPSDEPAREIDYILLRPAERFEALEHRVIDEREASDHRPVLLVLGAGG